MPLPYAHYPEWTGVFVGFSESPDSEVFLCDCAKPAIETFKRVGLFTGPGAKEYCGRVLPWPLTERLANKAAAHEDATSAISYQESVCHRCNSTVPSKTYTDRRTNCTEFEFRYGWYITQTALELGITFDVLLPREMLPHRVETTADMPQEIREVLEALADDPFSDPQDPYQKKLRRLYRELENLTRARFGFRGIGDAFIREAILYRVILGLFPGYGVERNARPSWLEGLELDVYVPDLELAIEHQGRQHYEPIEAWGGQAALKAVKARDVKKAQLCEEKGVRLLYVRYDEPLDYESIREKVFEKAPHTAEFVAEAPVEQPDHAEEIRGLRRI